MLLRHEETALFCPRERHRLSPYTRQLFLSCPLDPQHLVSCHWAHQASGVSMREGDWISTSPFHWGRENMDGKSISSFIESLKVALETKRKWYPG